MKLLLHTCCAPCSIQCVEALAEEGIGPDLYWYNPNIHPYTEYRSRLNSLRVFAEERTLPLVIDDDYGLRSFIKAVSSIEESPADKNMEGKSRCAYCYRFRLEKAAALAAEKAYNAFSTTLLISPYQNHELLWQIGEELAGIYHIDFLYRDFRPRYRKGREQARAAGFYMQKYCGCIYSEEERYLGKKAEASGGKISGGKASGGST